MGVQKNRVRLTARTACGALGTKRVAPELDALRQTILEAVRTGVAQQRVEPEETFDYSLSGWQQPWPAEIALRTLKPTKLGPGGEDAPVGTVLRYTHPRAWLLDWVLMGVLEPATALDEVKLQRIWACVSMFRGTVPAVPSFLGRPHVVPMPI